MILRRLINASRGASIIFVIIAFSIQAAAQISPIGLHESLMGNSGVAATDPTASGYYNPSLLLEKTGPAVNFSGNTFQIMKSEKDNSNARSTSLFPSYISSVDIFEDYRHEFFATTLSHFDGSVQNIKANYMSEISSNADHYLLGYAFAFTNFPMGFLVGLDYFNTKFVGSYEDNSNSNVSVISRHNNQNSQLALVMGLSSHHRFGSYTFGYSAKTRGYSLYKTTSGKTISTVYNSIDNTFNTYEDAANSDVPQVGYHFAVGHGFKLGHHEFLTDSVFTESSERDHSYSWVQTFGYRVEFENKMQYLCGLALTLKNKANEIGKSAYYSTGFSWVKRGLRTNVGFYFSDYRIEQQSQIVGVNFGTELRY